MSSKEWKEKPTQKQRRMDITIHVDEALEVRSPGRKTFVNFGVESDSHILGATFYDTHVIEVRRHSGITKVFVFPNTKSKEDYTFNEEWKNAQIIWTNERQTITTQG
jgi:hypothetical protein